MGEVLRVEGLQVQFQTNAGDVKALNGINFAQDEGEIYCLVGESGAGKSTLALSIMGILPQNALVTSGRVIFNGVDLFQASPDYVRSIRGKDISLVFQDARSALNPVQTVGEQLEEVIQTHSSLPTRTRNQMTQDILHEMGLPDPRRIMGEYPFNLSGGMCQRVLIAIALVLRPKLLIADEPTSNLDVTLQAEILERLRNLCRELDSAILFITHNMGVVAHIANRVGVMYAGTIVETAAVIPTFREPRHPYTAALLESLPRLDDVAKRLQPLPGTPPDMINLAEQCPYLPRCPKSINHCRLARRPPLEEVSEGHLVACYNPVFPVAR